VANFVVSFGGKGNILSQGSFAEALENNKALLQEFESDQALVERADGEADPEPSQPADASGKLIVAEEMEEGHISWDARKWLKTPHLFSIPDTSAVKMYLFALGGRASFFTIFAFMLLYHLILVGQTWFLGYWASEYTVYPSHDVPVVR
jgi:hypothetical protein